MRLDQVENRCGRSDAVDGQNLTFGFRALFQDVFEYLFLQVKRAVEPGAGIQSDFPDIACFRQISLPKRDFTTTLTDKLGMETERRANMACALNLQEGFDSRHSAAIFQPDRLRLTLPGSSRYNFSPSSSAPVTWSK